MACYGLEGEFQGERALPAGEREGPAGRGRGPREGVAYRRVLRVVGRALGRAWPIEGKGPARRDGRDLRRKDRTYQRAVATEEVRAGPG